MHLFSASSLLCCIVATGRSGGSTSTTAHTPHTSLWPGSRRKHPQHKQHSMSLRLLLCAAFAALSAAAPAVEVSSPPGGRRQLQGYTTNCNSLGSGCTRCSYKRASRGLLSTNTPEPTAPAIQQQAASPSDGEAGTVTAQALQRGRRGGAVSFGGGSGLGAWGSWTSSGGFNFGGGGGGGGSGGNLNCNTCNSAANYRLQTNNGVTHCGRLKACGVAGRT